MISFELQQRLWTEYLATMLVLNAGIDPSKVGLHQIMGFPEFVDSSEFYRYHSVLRYSFLDDRHYDFKLNRLETFEEWYQRL